MQSKNFTRAFVGGSSPRSAALLALVPSLGFPFCPAIHFSGFCFECASDCAERSSVRFTCAAGRKVRTSSRKNPFFSRENNSSAQTISKIAPAVMSATPTDGKTEEKFSETRSAPVAAYPAASRERTRTASGFLRAATASNTSAAAVRIRQIPSPSERIMP